MRKLMLGAVALSTLSLVVASAKAEVIYGFNDPSLNGFSISYDPSSVGAISESTTTGVTEGTGALHASVGSTGGYYQIDYATGNVPADLTANNNATLTLDAAAAYSDAPYITVAPVLYIDGTVNNANQTAFGAKLLFPSKTLPYDYDATTEDHLSYSLLIKDPFAAATSTTPADGDSTTATYTLAHIEAQVLATFASSATYDGFALEETTSTTAGDDLYIDNISVPTATPEPTSCLLLGAALTPMLIGRRRRVAV